MYSRNRPQYTAPSLPDPLVVAAAGATSCQLEPHVGQASRSCSGGPLAALSARLLYGPMERHGHCVGWLQTGHGTRLASVTRRSSACKSPSAGGPPEAARAIRCACPSAHGWHTTW